jgi:hypothetical protein
MVATNLGSYPGRHGRLPAFRLVFLLKFSL